jgi:Zinc finger, C2H2 type
MAVSDLDEMDHLAIDLSLDTDTNRFPSFSAASACPSLASSFASYGSSPVELGGDRRPSIAHSEASLILSSHGPSLRNSLSPMTPFSSDMLDMVMTNGSSMGCTPTEMTMSGMFQYEDLAAEDENLQWMAPQSKQALPVCSTAFATPRHYPIRQSQEGLFLSSDRGLVAGGSLESSLSRPIFHHRQQSDGLMPEHTTQWRPSMLQTPPRTVAPRATFQPILPSSPAYGGTPSTPIQTRYDESTTIEVVNTPYSLSPIYSPTQQPISVQNETVYQNIQPTLVRTLRASKHKASGRNGRRSAEKKETGQSRRLSKSGLSQSGMEYPSYIEMNLFACTADCVDKSGKRKKFKRQEHLKRHQRTCHTGFRPYYCWVPGCTTEPFSRTDNLNSHLLKTHGKNSPAARNRYIATLDPKSGVYDIDYRGPFTESGWPIRSK